MAPRHGPVDGGRGITQVRYQPAEPELPVESFTLASLRDRVDPTVLNRPERLDFNLVLVCTAGRGSHEVDFTQVTLEPGRLLHVRPGQVHRWVRPSTFEAELLVFPDVTRARRLVGSTVTVRDLDTAELARALELIRQVRHERRLHEAPERGWRAVMLLRDLFIVRFGLDVDHGGARGNLPGAYLAFCHALATQPLHRSIGSYATDLGYSPRTLTRACLRATGRTAKQVLDEQLLLEAGRRLAHTDRAVSEIASELGFTEATNFTKFFIRLSGKPPRAWRDGSAPSLVAD
jgi:AraC-like DNA-binding protein